MPEEEIEVVRSDGEVGTIPVSDLYKALTSGAYQLVNPNQEIPVMNSRGEVGDIPAKDWVRAIDSGQYSYSPAEQEVMSEPDSDWVDETKRFGKALGRAAMNYADLPSNILGALQRGSGATPMLNGVSYDELQGTPAEEALLERYNASNYRPSDLAEGIFQPNDTTADQRIRSRTYETGADLVGGGLLGRFAKATNAPKFGNFLGSEQPLSELARTGAAVGGISQGAQEMGANPIAAELGAALAVPTGASLFSRFPKNAIDKAQLYPLGLSPKKFDLDLYNAAQGSGIDLPAAAYTDSRLMHLANSVAAKSPYFGDKIQAKNLKTTSQAQNKIQNILDRVGPADTEDIQKEIAGRFARAGDLLPKNVTTPALFTLGSTEKALDHLGGLGYLSNGSSELQKIAGGIDNAFRNGQSWNAIDSRVPVKKLVQQKQNINANKRVWGEDAGAAKQVRGIGHAIGQDIDTYGMIDPKWFKELQKANKLYGQVEQRNKLENIFDKATNQGSGTLGFGNLSKAIHDKKSGRKIKGLVGSDNLEEVKNLGTVARGLSRKNLNVPNPSGSTSTALSAAYGYGALKGLTQDPISTLAGLAGANRLSNLLTDQKYVDLAAQFARDARASKSKPSLTQDIGARTRKLTPLSPSVLNKALNEGNEEGRQRRIPRITVSNPSNWR